MDCLYLEVNFHTEKKLLITSDFAMTICYHNFPFEVVIASKKTVRMPTQKKSSRETHVVLSN